MQTAGKKKVFEFCICGFEGIYLRDGPVAQLVRAPPCHGGGREFESLLGRYFLEKENNKI